MKLKSLWFESTVAHVGELPIMLGSGEDFTLSYGGASGREPFLFGKFPKSAMQQLCKRVGRCKLIEPMGKEAGRIDCSRRAHKQTQVAHVGEAHCTISMGRELRASLDSLKEKFGVDSDQEVLRAVGLFDESGNGIPFPIKLKSQNNQPALEIFRAGHYGDEIHPLGPYVIVVLIDVPNWIKVRSSLGLSDYPDIGETYKPHVTIGYTHGSQGPHVKRQLRPR